MFGEAELRQLHRMFEDLELTTAQGMSAQELGIYVDFWLDIADTDVSKGMRRIWSNPLTRDAGLQVALAQLGAWESSRDDDAAIVVATERRASRHLGPRSVSLSMTDGTDYVGNPIFELGFVVPKRMISGREVELATEAGPRTMFLSYIAAGRGVRQGCLLGHVHLGGSHSCRVAVTDLGAEQTRVG